MGVFRDTLLILVTTSQRSSYLHTIVNQKAVVKQLIVKLRQCPFFLIHGHFLSLEVVRFSQSDNRVTRTPYGVLERFHPEDSRQHFHE